MEERKTIQENDLMIGNWFIGYDNKPFQWNIHEFEAIAHHISIDEIIKEPIKLSEEILLKCGFKKQNDNTWIYSNNEKYIIEYLFYKYSFRIVTDRYNSTHIRTIEYIHELQNLYKVLTKTDLDINLWKI